MVDGVALSPHVEDLFGVVYHGRPHPIRSFWGWKGGLSDFERFDTKANKMIHPLVRQGVHLDGLGPRAAKGFVVVTRPARRSPRPGPAERRDLAWDCQ